MNEKIDNFCNEVNKRLVNLVDAIDERIDKGLEETHTSLKRIGESINEKMGQTEFSLVLFVRVCDHIQEWQRKNYRL